MTASVVFDDDNEYGVILFAGEFISVELEGDDGSSIAVTDDPDPGVKALLAPFFIGPPGPPGGESFEFDQDMASTHWHIVHNLGRIPTVTILDSSNRVVEGDVQYADLNTVDVYFTWPFGGRAFLI